MFREPASALPADLRVRIEALATRSLGAPARVVAARPLAGGASLETTAIDLAVGGETLGLVVRRDRSSRMRPNALTRAQEFALLEIAHAGGVRCPRPRWFDEGPPACFVMDKVPGASVGRRVVRLPELADARHSLAGQIGRELAGIHRLPVDTLTFLTRPRDGQTPAESALAEVKTTMDTLQRDNPVWELGLRWLSQRLPPRSGPDTLVHGDCRVGNVLVDPQGLTSVIDWEFAHIGDPAEDLAWTMVRDWRFENDALPVGGVGTLEQLLRGYTANGGHPPEPHALRWWEIAGNLRWAVVCHAQAERHLSGLDRSVEFASLGRKAAEIEWELLDQIRRAGAER